MAAYGALVSLMHIIDSIEKHPSPPISMDKKQVESLTEIVTFLQEFLDGYISPVVDSHEADPLERRIADAVYAAEDVIESHIVVQIDSHEADPFERRVESSTRGKRTNIINLFRGVCKCASASASASATIEEDFYHDLQQVIEEMNLIKKEAMETAAVAQLQREVSSTHAGLLTSSSTIKENVMAGFDQVFLEVLDKLTGYELNRQIIPILGMGGIGKTTLARNLFKDALVKDHFDIRAWTTISQAYNVRETLREVYIQARGHVRDRNENEKLSDLSENQLGEKLRKFLYGRRYLVIMDDIWSVEVWDKIKFFFPDNQNGSRIIVTTRLSNLSSQWNESYKVGMKFLDEASSWDFFCKTVFVKGSCPLELENIGKAIVANCKGLPLSIATIGGLLAKSERRREYWERIEQNLNSIVINSNDEYCLKILRMSYIYLPNYLKPCFLYMGVFEEDRRIRVSMLKKLWVSEGFLKPRSGKCLETTAQEYLKELVDRNLILVDELGSIGNVKFCKIHDLLRDLCLKEAEKERFYQVIRDDPLQINSERLVVLPPRLLTSEVLGSLSHARSIICDEAWDGEVRLPHNLRLLRTFKAYDKSWGGVYFIDNVFELVNLRYLAVRVHQESNLPSSIDLLWNLHTLFIDCSGDFILPIEIWKLHQLRHLRGTHFCHLILPDPPNGNNDIVIMENLQTLKGMKDLFLNEKVVKRIPNVKKLKLGYNVKQMKGENCLSYLHCLSKLESFNLNRYVSGEYLQGISFPNSIKKLYLHCGNFHLEGLLEKIGRLPLLEKLRLAKGQFATRRWEIVESQFPCLKFLLLDSCAQLECWTLEGPCLPRLEEVHLQYMTSLEEIPSEIGEIPTLRSINLLCCNESVAKSLKRIVQEQEFQGEPPFHVRVMAHPVSQQLRSLATPNFQVEEIASHVLMLLQLLS